MERVHVPTWVSKPCRMERCCHDTASILTPTAARRSPGIGIGGKPAMPFAPPRPMPCIRSGRGMPSGPGRPGPPPYLSWPCCHRPCHEVAFRHDKC